MSCPKCGYSGHNTVSHWGTGEIECENCRHDYVPKKKEGKEQSHNIVPRPMKPDHLDIIVEPSRDIYVNGPIKGASTDFSPIGPVRVGRTSGKVFDDFVRGDDGLIVGNIIPTGHILGLW